MELTPLGERVQSCQKMFSDVLSVSHYMGAATQSALQEQSELFRIWTVNTSVLRRSRFSLEYCLREAPYVEGMIREVLTTTYMTLKRLYETICALNSTSGMPQASDDHLTSPSDEILEAVLDMLSSDMRLLQQMARRIRLASTMKQNREASDRSHCDNDESKAYKEYARVTILERDYPDVEESIKDRLALAMLIRRYRMIYRRKRYKDTVLLEPSSEITEGNRLRSMERTKRARPQSAPFRTYASGIHTSGAISTVFSHTGSDRTGTKVNERRYRQLSSPSISQGPRGIGGKLKADYPPRPKLTGAQPCPYCSMLLSPLEVASEEAWIEHVREDLEPFVCLYKECQLSREELLFDTSAQWIEHMQEAHLTKWRCRSHRERYDTREEMIKHLKEQHAEAFRHEEELNLLADDSARPFGRLFEECPFCAVSKSESLANLEIHISEHLTSLASKSIQLADRWEQILAANEHDTGSDGSTGSCSSADSIADKARSTILHAAGHYPEPIPNPQDQPENLQGSTHTTEVETTQYLEPETPSWIWDGLHQVSSRDWIGAFDLVIDMKLCHIDLPFLENCVSRRPGDDPSAHEQLRLCHDDVCGHRTNPVPSGSVSLRTIKDSARVQFSHQYFSGEVAPQNYDRFPQQGKQGTAHVTGVVSSPDSKRQKLSQEGDEGLSTQAYRGNVASGKARVQFGDHYRHGEVMQHFHDSGPTGSIKESAYVEEIMASLSFEQMESRLQTIGKAHTKTCYWLLSNQEYRSWRDVNKGSEHHGILWLKGKPGSGKSTAMKFLYDVALRQAHDDLVVSFFFNARGHSLERSVEGMYRSLLYQLLGKVPQLQSVLESRPMDRATHAWTVSGLQDLFFHAVLGLGPTPLVCYIDALDECDMTDVRDIVCFLQDLVGTTSSKGQRFYVCFSSRHYPHISTENGQEIVLEDQDGHENDIAEYIRARLRIGKSSIANGIIKQIQSRADGVFLWAVLVVLTLNEEYDRGRMHDLLRRVREMPSRLSDLFQEILTSNAANQNELVNILQWILYARRPLDCSELYHALRGTEFVADTSIDVSDVSKDDLTRFVVDGSKGLARVVSRKKPVVEFIHESVGEYLIQSEGMAMLEPALSNNLPGLCHDRLKSCCLGNVLATENEVANRLQERRESLVEKLPFLQYAVQGIIYHADSAQSSGVDQKAFIREFPLRSLVKAWNALEQDTSRHYSSSVELAYILVDNDAFHLLQVELQQNASLAHAMPGELGETLLKVAIARNNEDITKLLLRRGAMGHSVLADACKSGSLEVVKLLLKYGADINIVPEEYSHTPLQIASTRGMVDLVRLLLDHGADVNSQAHHGGALGFAASSGNVEVVRLLLNYGAALNAGDGTILEAASSKGYRDVVQLLLEFGADVEARCGGALKFAASSGHEKVVRLLLDSGADPNAGGGEILDKASSNGHGKIVQTLLDAGADPNKDALRFAASSGHEGIVRLLLSAGADVNAGAGAILEAASSNGHENVVQILLEHVAGPNNRALRHAASLGNERIVRRLLDSGADVNVDVLEAASSRGHDNIMRLLLDRGAKRHDTT